MRLRTLSIVGVIALMASLPGCGGGGAKVQSEISTTTKGQGVTHPGRRHRLSYGRACPSNQTLGQCEPSSRRDAEWRGDSRSGAGLVAARRRSVPAAATGDAARPAD
jgi:hypothetical protein